MMNMSLMLAFAPALGRILIGFFFCFFGIWNIIHWRPTLDVMRQKKIPFAHPLLIIGIIWQTVLGLLLILGLYVEFAALLLIPFTVISVFIFHAFWNLQGELRQLNMIVFITNLTMSLGGLLLLVI